MGAVQNGARSKYERLTTSVPGPPYVAPALTGVLSLSDKTRGNAANQMQSNLTIDYNTMNHADAANLMRVRYKGRMLSHGTDSYAIHGQQV